METLASLSTPSGVNQHFARGPRFASGMYQPISCADVTRLPNLMQDWNFEYVQLSPGAIAVSGGLLALDCALVGRITFDRSLLCRGCAPHGSVALLIPGRSSGDAFVRGRKLESTQCVTIADGASVEAITRGHYINVALAIDLNALLAGSPWLNDSPLSKACGIGIEYPDPLWVNRMLDTVERIFTAVEQCPAALARVEVQASLRDQLLAVIADFNIATRREEHRTRDVRAQQRVAVERAREYIQAKLSEPLRLSDLCRYAHVQARSLEYGFREITGLSPIAYVKALRLNAVRRVLSRSHAPEQSISRIALDQGFWHLSQFAVDYRKFFGETPTSTRQRVLSKRTVH